MSNREEFEYEAGQELKLPVSIIKQARMGGGYDHAFDSMNVMQPLNQWWHWWQAGREGMDKKFTGMSVQLANAESKCRVLAAESDKTSERMQQLIQIINNADNDYCMCGDAMKNHTHGGCGHPTGMFDYHYNQWLQAENKTPATDAFLAEVRASAITDALKSLDVVFDTDCVMESNGISYEDAEQRTAGAYAASKALEEFAAQLRKGVQS
ncbi:hypothetical protein [Citrobacter sp. Marseille-Q3906]|uniref:hypothetical protein n=1 Tax=Citrobacter sp. Marseille-Q3906 TaxID=2866574 RepID=UPI001CE46994|nr:hypothetical protein [Citrobacter sp. Marseille-Q3906]